MLQLYTSPVFAAEKAYAASVLLDELLGLPYELHFETGEKNYRLKLPNGAELIIEDHFFGKQQAEAYLKVSNIPQTIVTLTHPFEPNAFIAGIYGRAYFSQENKRVCCGIDLFASAFFMLARWEEYVGPERDAYGRFPAEHALALRAGILDRPIVNEYAELFGQMFRALGWNPPLKARRFSMHLSHDVDHPRLWWSPAGRLRTLGASLFLRKNLRETIWWLRSGRIFKKDPYDIFDEWMDIAEKNKLVSHFNFLGERPKTADSYYSLHHPFVRSLLQKITHRGHSIGFHPSRQAHADPAVFASELNSLRAASPQPVTTGRQHYLCFSAPESWQRWSDAGMKWDSTLGYPEAEGFRCGICCEYPVFNFLTRQTLALREKPLIAMDVTLAHYRRYKPEQALERLMLLRRAVEKHGGEFVLLWHNSSWNTYFWSPWKQVFNRIISNAEQGTSNVDV